MTFREVLLDFKHGGPLHMLEKISHRGPALWGREEGDGGLMNKVPRHTKSH